MVTRIKATTLGILLATWSLISCLSSVDLVKGASAPALLLANELGQNVDPSKYLVS